MKRNNRHDIRSISLFLMVLTFTHSTLSEVLLGSPRDLAAGAVSGVSSMDAGDIDGDGLTDVVVIEGGKHAGGRKSFSWFKAGGNQGKWQGFNINPDAPLRAFLGATRLWDMDGDGDLDLVVSSDNHSGNQKEADVFVFLNPRPEGDAKEAWGFHRLNDTTLPLHHINDMESKPWVYENQGKAPESQQGQ